MTRILDRAWKSMRRTTKEEKKAEDRRKGGTKQEATIATKDNRDNGEDNEKGAIKTERNHPP